MKMYAIRIIDSYRQLYFSTSCKHSSDEYTTENIECAALWRSLDTARHQMDYLNDCEPSIDREVVVVEIVE